MQEAHHQQLHARLNACLTAMQGIRDIRAKSTMYRFYKNCRIVWVVLDEEMVNCRRQKKITLKYTELEAEFLEHIHNFEQWQIMSALMY